MPNPVTWFHEKRGVPYCQQCVKDNPQNGYVIATTYPDDKCDVCGKLPVIPPSTNPVIREHFTCRIF